MIRAASVLENRDGAAPGATSLGAGNLDTADAVTALPVIPVVRLRTDTRVPCGIGSLSGFSASSFSTRFSGTCRHQQKKIM